MPRKRYTAEQIITKLRQAEVELARGQTMAAVCRKLETSEQTYYRWRKEYGGGHVDHMKRLKAGSFQADCDALWDRLVIGGVRE